MEKIERIPIEEQGGPRSREELEANKIPYEEYCRKLFDVGNEFSKPQALKGIRWLSCTMYIFTPHMVSNLAELGAEVIKIEFPRIADPMKHTSPFNEAYVYPLHDDRPLSGQGLGVINANVNKYFITLDYHRPEAIEIMYKLVKMSDGLTECYRPGTFDKWKISYRYLQEINPRFIYVWGGGFGYGPKVFGGSYDILGQAHTGLAAITGFHEDFGGFPVKHTNWVIDWYSGTLGTAGILAALYWREKTGLGTMIEFSQIMCAARALGHTWPLYGKWGIVRQRWGNWDTLLCVHGIICCGKSDYPDAKNPQLRDEARYVMISAFKDEDFKELCKIINRMDLYEKYQKHKDRVEATAQIEIYHALEEWARDKSRSEVAKILTEAGLLAMPVLNDKEVYESPHFRERGTIRWQADPSYGDLLVHSSYSAGLLSRTPRRKYWDARPVGADNLRVYRELLGYPMSVIKEWYAKGII